MTPMAPRNYSFLVWSQANNPKNLKLYLFAFTPQIERCNIGTRNTNAVSICCTLYFYFVAHSVERTIQDKYCLQKQKQICNFIEFQLHFIPPTVVQEHFQDHSGYKRKWHCTFGSLLDPLHNAHIYQIVIANRKKVDFNFQTYVDIG